MIRPGKAIPPCMREAIEEMEGSSHKEVADRIGCHIRTVQRWRSRKREEGRMESRQGGKRWSKVEDKELVQHCLEGFWNRKAVSDCIKTYASKVGVTEPQVRKAVARLGLREVRKECLSYRAPSDLGSGLAFSLRVGEEQGTSKLLTLGVGKDGTAWAEEKREPFLYPVCRHPLSYDGVVDGSTFLRLPSQEVSFPSVLKDEASASLFLQRHGFEPTTSNPLETAWKVLRHSYEMGGLSVPEGVDTSPHKEALLLSGLRMAKRGGGVLHPPCLFPVHTLPLFQEGLLKGASQRCLLFLLGKTSVQEEGSEETRPHKGTVSFREALGGRSVKPLGERWMTLLPSSEASVERMGEDEHSPPEPLGTTNLAWGRESPLVTRVYQTPKGKQGMEDGGEQEDLWAVTSRRRMVTTKERLKWFRSEMPPEAWCLAWELREEDLSSIRAEVL